MSAILFNNSGNGVYGFGLTLQQPLSSFHGRFVQSWNELPPNGQLKEIAIRIVTIIVAPIFYPLLGTLSLTGQMLMAIGSRQHIRLNAEKLSRSIEALRKSGRPDWQKEAMTLVRQSRYDDPWAELQRLRATKVLTDDVSIKLDRSINKVDSNLSKEKSDRIKLTMAQAQEIKSIYRSTHHVFIHAQASNWLGLTYLVKELHRAFEPSANIKHFKFLRPPLKLAKPGIASSLWKTFRNTFFEKENITNVQEYINSKWFVMDSDGETREHLLSADAYFFNAQRYESSLFFLVNNSNILGKPDTIKFFYKQIINYYRPHLSKQKIGRLVDKVFNAVRSEESLCGNLFVICVPKEKSQKIQYRAHPFGSVCNCHPAAESRDILEKLQNDSFDYSTKCESLPIPQYRIYTPLLKPETSPIYLLTPYTKACRKAMKAQIRNVVKEMEN